MHGTNQFLHGSRIQMDHAAAGWTSKSPTARPPHLNTSRTNVSERLQCGFRPASRPAASSARSSASALPRLAQRGADVGVMRRPTIALVAGREQKMNSFAPHASTVREKGSVLSLLTYFLPCPRQARLALWTLGIVC